MWASLTKNALTLVGAEDTIDSSSDFHVLFQELFEAEHGEKALLALQTLANRCIDKVLEVKLDDPQKQELLKQMVETIEEQLASSKFGYDADLNSGVEQANLLEVSKRITKITASSIETSNKLLTSLIESKCVGV